GLTGKDGRPATVGECVDANRGIFSTPANVFFGIGVRNNIVHAKATDATEEEIRRAAGYLFQAISDVRAHTGIPAEARQEVFAVSPDAPTKPVTTSPRLSVPSAPKFTPINQAGQTMPATPAPLQPTAPLTTPVTSPTSYTTRVSAKPATL